MVTSLAACFIVIAAGRVFSAKSRKERPNEHDHGKRQERAACDRVRRGKEVNRGPHGDDREQEGQGLTCLCLLDLGIGQFLPGLYLAGRGCLCHSDDPLDEAGLDLLVLIEDRGRRQRPGPLPLF
jgi:hypothetical protein